MMTIYKIEHKYAPYTLYLSTTMSVKELSDLSLLMYWEYFESPQNPYNNCVAAPELVYLLTKHYGCREVSRRQWLRTCTRHRKSIDIYQIGERHRGFGLLGESYEASVKRLLPSAVLVNIDNLQVLLKPWYDAYRQEFEAWLDRVDNEPPTEEDERVYREQLAREQLYYEGQARSNLMHA